MAIFDAYGQQVRSPRLYKSSNRYQNGLQWTPKMDKDFNELFNSSDFASVMTQSRLVYSNMGVPKGAIDQKAGMVAGDGWELDYNGEQAEWGEEACEKLSKWLDFGEISGRSSFNAGLETDSIAVSRDGDFFILMILDENGRPRYQKIPAHRIGEGQYSAGKMDTGPFVGYHMASGVVCDTVGRVVAYQVLDPEGDREKDYFVPAENVIHVHDRMWHDQARGLPEFAAVFNQLRQSNLSEEWELLAQLMASSYALVEYNDNGGPDIEDPLVSLNSDFGDATDNALAVEEFAGGAVKYFQSNSGGKLESISTNRPSDMWEKFQDRINRIACTSVRWPYELVWKAEGMNGNGIRHVQEMARMAVSARQCTLAEAYGRLLAWAASVFIARNELSMPSDPMDVRSMCFIYPSKFSIDPRHDAKTQIELYKMGMVNLTQILREKKRKVRAHFDERCAEITLRKQVKEEWEQKTGISIDEREMLMLTPNEMAEDSTTNEETEDEEPV